MIDSKPYPFHTLPFSRAKKKLNMITPYVTSKLLHLTFFTNYPFSLELSSAFDSNVDLQHQTPNIQHSVDSLFLQVI